MLGLRLKPLYERHIRYPGQAVVTEAGFTALCRKASLSARGLGWTCCEQQVVFTAADPQRLIRQKQCWLRPVKMLLVTTRYGWNWTCWTKQVWINHKDRICHYLKTFGPLAWRFISSRSMAQGGAPLQQQALY